MLPPVDILGDILAGMIYRIGCCAAVLDGIWDPDAKCDTVPGTGLTRFNSMLPDNAA